jgi:CspA family cold shock protein
MEKKEFTGTVVWFNPQLGYGFASREEGGKDIFIYYSDIEMSGYKVIMAGDVISFSEDVRNNRLVATNVKVIKRENKKQ